MVVQEMVWNDLQTVQAQFITCEAIVTELCEIYDNVIHSAKAHSIHAVPRIFESVLSIMEHAREPEPFMLEPFRTSLEYHGACAVVLPEVKACEAFPPTLEFALVCVHSQSREMLRSATWFLRETFRSNHYDVYMCSQKWLQINYDKVLKAVFFSVTIHAPLDLLQRSAELFFIICRHMLDDDMLGCQRMEEHLQSLIMTSPQLTNVAEHLRRSHHCVLALALAEDQREKFATCLCELARACRL